VGDFAFVDLNPPPAEYLSQFDHVDHFHLRDFFDVHFSEDTFQLLTRKT